MAITTLPEMAQIISAVGFLGYGVGCLTTQRMREEFLRYRMPRLRVFTGSLQIMAGIGLLVGFQHPVIAFLASLGLSVMMVVALGVRVRIKDPISGFLQALICLILNLFVLQSQVAKLPDNLRTTFWSAF